jgi:hypothetical protein
MWQVRHSLVFQIDERFGIVSILSDCRIPQRDSCCLIPWLKTLRCLRFERSILAISIEGERAIDFLYDIAAILKPCADS